MTESNQVKQFGVKAKNLAGRDINTTNNILPPKGQLDYLSEKYKMEKENQEYICEVIEELQHYKNERSGVRGLSQKLTDADMEYLLEQAEELKEVVSKLIVKYQNIYSAQQIITFLLAEVESIFNAKIKPQIPSITSESHLKLILRECLEKEIQPQLGENVLEIFNRQINGMVYFLTGNCHLEWK